MRSALMARAVFFVLAFTGIAAFGAEFRAGAGKSEIKVTPDTLPVEGYTVVHDQAAVRVLLMDDGKSRYAIVVIETPSISDGVISAAKEALTKTAKVAAEHAIVLATHSTAAPHIGLGGGPGSPGGPGGAPGGAPGGGSAGPAGGSGGPGGAPAGGPGGPGGLFSGPGATLYAKAYQAAVEEAVQQATNSLQPAKLGFGVGATDISVNRDMPTPKGYSEGANSAGFSDRTLPVVRIDKMDGKPLALVLNPAVRSVVLADSTDSNGKKVLSADLSGATSRYIEKWYGGDTVALFIMGAGVDQAPMLVAAQKLVQPDGSVAQVDIHDAGFTLLARLGERLGSDAIQAAQNIKATEQPTVEVMRKTLKVPSQARSFGLPPGSNAGPAAGPTNGPGAGPGAGASTAAAARPAGGGNASSNAPVLSYTYTPGPEIDFPVVIMRIGDIAIAGMWPELSSSIGAQIKAKSPYANTMVATMADGGAKYIVDEQSFDHFTAEARGSQYARGAAEQVGSALDDMLTQMKQSSAGK